MFSKKTRKLGIFVWQEKIFSFDRCLSISIGIILYLQVSFRRIRLRSVINDTLSWSTFLNLSTYSQKYDTCTLLTLNSEHLPVSLLHGVYMYGPQQILMKMRIDHNQQCQKSVNLRMIALTSSLIDMIRYISLGQATACRLFLITDD